MTTQDKKTGDRNIKVVSNTPSEKALKDFQNKLIELQRNPLTLRRDSTQREINT